MPNESLREYKNWSEKIIFEQAGKRTAGDLFKLISQVKQILAKEGEEGQGKLKKTIPEIRRSSSGSEYFVDDKVSYLPEAEEAVFVGDTHGDSLAAEAIIKQTGFLGDGLHGRQRFMVFLGDYGDRGRNDVRNWEIVLALKSRYPQNVILLRGNHEDGLYYPSDLEESLEARFGSSDAVPLYANFLELFPSLPNMVVTANGIVGVHGGIPHSVIRSLTGIKNNEAVLRQMRWNDPDEYEPGFAPNSRGETARLFGREPFEHFLKTVGGEVIIRSHEYPREGYKLFFTGRLVTIFSNGSGSPESSYRDRVSPKFITISLTESVVKIEPAKHIKSVDYSILR